MSRRGAWQLALLGMLALVLRLAFLIDYDEDVDSLRFALAVEDFDVSSLRPHAPFYPVYVAAAKVARLLAPTPELALGAVGAVAGAVTVVATALLAREALGRPAAWVAAALALGSPFLWLTSLKLMSDMTGTALCTVALWLCVRGRRLVEVGRDGSAASLRTVAVVLCGLLLGTRLSYFPVALVCTAVVAHSEGGGRAWLARLRDFTVGVVLWLVPLVVVAGPAELLRITLVQGAGHFTRWGGSVITVPSPATRLVGSAWGLWANVLGGAWVDGPAWRWLGAPLIVLLLARAFLSIERPAGWFGRHPELVLSAAAYLVWALLGQNSAFKPRHFAPLAPILVVALTAGAVALGRRQRLGLVAAGLLSAQWTVDAVALAREHQQPSPAAALVAFLRAGGAPGAEVLTCDLGRMIAEGAPGRPLTVLSSAAAFVNAVERRTDSSRWVVTSECLTPAARGELSRRGLTLRVLFQRPRSRYVDPLWNELALLHCQPLISTSKAAATASRMKSESSSSCQPGVPASRLATAASRAARMAAASVAACPPRATIMSKMALK